MITVEVRTPFLVLERGGALWLADAEGHVLEPVYALEEYGLPVVSDEGGFASDFYGKWEAAGRCFRSLPGDEAGRLAAIRCGDFGTLELAFKGDPVRVVVGAAAPAADLARFRARRAEWEGLFGPLALVHLGFDGRVYVRTAEPAGDDVPPPDKGDELMPKNDYIVGFDIGTRKIVAVIGEVTEERKVEIIGIGTADSHGLRKGVVVDLDATTKAIKKAQEEAELMAGVEIDSAFFGISGAHIKSFNSKGVVAVSGKNREITREDVRRVVDQSKAIPIPPDREIIHIIPQEFIVDDQDGIKDPAGMSGIKLEVNVHIITAALTSLQNLKSCVERAGIRIEEVVLNQIATAQAVLTQDERELGVGQIDIGAGTTEVAIYERGSLWYTSIIPIGGDNFTNDIAVGLRTPIPEAERIKKKFGCLAGPPVDDQETIEVPSVGKGRKPRVLSRQLLADIIQPRAEEIFRLVDTDIKRMGYEKSLNSGIVLTGGTALLEGLEEVAEEIFDLPVRRGDPAGVGGLVDRVTTPDFSTAVGLILYGFRIWQDRGLSKDKKRGAALPVQGLVQGRIRRTS